MGGVAADFIFADLFKYDIVADLWTDLTTATLGPAPPPRRFFGFAYALGALYVFGGQGVEGMATQCFPLLLPNPGAAQRWIIVMHTDRNSAR